MKKFLLIFLVILSLPSLTQKNQVIHLKNGSSIRGEIIANDSTHVRVLTKDGSYWNFNQTEIASVENYQFAIKDNGFYNRTSLGILGGDNVGGGLQIVNGYSFNRHWETGFGIGIEQLNWSSYIPVFAEGRYSILSGETRPFISVMAGYEMPLRNFEFDKGGFTTGIQMGISHYFTSKIAISTSIGYRYCYMKQQNQWWDDFITTTQMNRFEIRLGFVFR